jgi:chromosome segregation ATPase
MKNFQVNLFIVLAIGLCGLCAWQWYEQTVQRAEIQTLNRMVYDRDAAIQGDTNSLATLNHQVDQMDASLTEMKAVAATNEQLIVSQKAEIGQLEFANENFTNEIAQYQAGVDALEAKLKEAYAGLDRQNGAISNLVAQRNDLVRKYNDEVKDRNDIVSKYNNLVKQVKKLQSGSNNSTAQ